MRNIISYVLLEYNNGKKVYAVRVNKEFFYNDSKKVISNNIDSLKKKGLKDIYPMSFIEDHKRILEYIFGCYDKYRSMLKSLKDSE